ncbi:MAG: hypothetical protein WC595_04580 [Candidatus Nanoarchaeia archaeon]
MPAKSIEWNNEDGTKYKISYSEELQLKNLEATRRQTRWLKRNMYIMAGLLLVLMVFTLISVYALWRLDQFDFFTKVAYR